VTGLRIKMQVIVFDAADLASVSTFWAGVLGGTVKTYDDWHMVFVDDEPRIGIQHAPNHVRPDWPDGTQQQMHLDFWVEDAAEAHELVMSLGATLLQAAEQTDAPDTFQVYADPAGHPFCICWMK